MKDSYRLEVRVCGFTLVSGRVDAISQEHDGGEEACVYFPIGNLIVCEK